MEVEALRNRQAQLVTRLTTDLSPQEMAEASQELEEVTRLLEQRD